MFGVLYTQYLLCTRHGSKWFTSIESWAIKKAEHWRIHAFELWCWRRLLSVPWTARRSNQSILKEINPGISLKEMMLKLKLQYFGHLMWRVDLLEKTLMLRGAGGGVGWGGWGQEKGTTKDKMAGWHHWLDGREFEWTLGVGDGQGGLACCDSWGHKVLDTTERLNWTELNYDLYFLLSLCCLSIIIYNFLCISYILIPNHFTLFECYRMLLWIELFPWFHF